MHFGSNPCGAGGMALFFQSLQNTSNTPGLPIGLGGNSIGYDNQINNSTGIEFDRFFNSSANGMVTYYENINHINIIANGDKATSLVPGGTVQASPTSTNKARRISLRPGVRPTLPASAAQSHIAELEARLAKARAMRDIRSAFKVHFTFS